jgi:hypothetical protein
MEPDLFLNPMASPDYRMRSSNKSRGKDPGIEALSSSAMASRTPFTRGDGDASSSLTEEATRGHSRPNWKQKITSDGRPI